MLTEDESGMEGDPVGAYAHVIPERQVSDAVISGMVYSNADMKQLLSLIISPPTLLYLEVEVDTGEFDNLRKAVQHYLEQGVVGAMVEQYKKEGKIG